MTEPSKDYKDGEVVWVKWSNSWWPGEVHDISRVPEDITSSLRKPVIAFVKFLQEDSFELVRSNNNISKYACDKKMEYIKKGIDKYRTNAKMKDNFTACITKAEVMTGGNVNILQSFDTPAKSKPSSTPSTPDSAKKSISISSQTPLASTSAKKSAATTPGTYNSSVKVQNTTSAEQSKTNEKRLTCTMCPFTTDRMNLLMMHIKGHSLEIQSRVSASTSMIEIRRPIVPKSSASRKLEIDDGIAEDVRKIKESMKEQKSSPSPTPISTGRKSRAPAPKVDKVTPKPVKSRASKRGAKAVKETSPEVSQEEEEEKPKVNEELKKELLADWLDEDDDISTEKEKIETPKAPLVEEKPKSIEKVSEKSSVPIRNIPKKQRVSEIYIQPETPLVVKEEDETPAVPLESSRKSQTNQRTGGRRKLNASSTAIPDISQEEAKMEIDEDEKLLMATAELLNDIVPAKSVTESSELDQNRLQLPSTTFQNSNEIDKRNLPPKERNKRIFRARNKSLETSTSSITAEIPKVQNDEQTAVESVKIVPVNKNDRQELMLPHKKKQSSRLLQTTVTEAIKNLPVAELVGGRKKKRKSSSDAIGNEEMQAPIVETLPQSPLRESAIESEEPKIEAAAAAQQNRGQKRHLSNENLSIDDQVEQPELKKFHKSFPLEPRIVTCGSNETICITSKGALTVARRDSLKTTQANSVVVTSQIIISEPIASPEVVTTASNSSNVVSLPQQALKNALKIPMENMEDFKKQGLLTIENNRTKLTPKGLQIFKEYQRDEKTVSNNNVQEVSTSSTITSVDSALSSISEDANEAANEIETVEEEKVNESDDKTSQDVVIESKEEPMEVDDSLSQKNDELKEESGNETENSKHESDQNGSEPLVKEQKSPTEIVEEESPKESLETEHVDEKKEDLVKLDPDESKTDEPNELESQKKSETPEVESQKDDEKLIEDSTKEEELTDESNATKKQPLENGSKEGTKDDDAETQNDDPNTSSGAGLIALQAENFGGPPNCFYLCRQIDDRYEPVDSQILVLNAQNALVPYEGDALTPGAEHPLGTESLSGYSQLSPNSNIIINTPNGQKVELNYFAIVALQESADENGVASMEYAGEQFELNINAILEAIAAQQDSDGADSTSLIDGTIDATGNALILTESSDLPVDIKHSATQVSETLSKPIMSTTVAPEITTSGPVLSTIADKNLNIEDSLAAIGVTQTSRANVPKSLELPITVTNPTIAETVNHRKLAAAAAAASTIIGNSSEVVIQTTDNGSDD